MPCTTFLAGKDATYNGSTMIARNDDSGSGHFEPKKWTVVNPANQPKVYTSVISHVKVELPDNPQRYTSMPNALKGQGVWAAAGVNESNVAMTATETITSNERVLAADPLVEYQPARGSRKAVPGGIGEEDIVTLVLPYIRSAREGVKRLGSLLEEYGTYEMNGIAFQDRSEVWMLESVGGHHWIAKKVPDDSYVVMPNQLWIDSFDLKDAEGQQKEHMASKDLRVFIEKNHLDLSTDGNFNPRLSFGSNDDADHCYNTPRAWFGYRYLNPGLGWDGPAATYGPESDDIPWSMVPEHRITPEDIKYVLSSHYQGTPYDPYGRYGDHSKNGMYRSIGINRNDFMSITEIRPDVPEDISVIEWIAFGSNAFNAMVPMYANVTRTPAFLRNTTKDVSTDNFYWISRLTAALADASYKRGIFYIERYQQRVQSKGRELILKWDQEYERNHGKSTTELLEQANDAIASMLKDEATDTLGNVLFEASNNMKNQYSRSDA